MAEETPRPSGNGEPPKIKLNLGSSFQRPKTGPKEDQPSAGAPSIRIRPTDKKAETTRIDLAMAQPPPPSEKGETQPVRPDVGDLPKRATVRVDVPSAVKADTQRVKAETKRVDPSAISKATTMRVEVEERKKVETTRLDLASEAARKPAPKVDLRDLGETDDVFKRKTIPVGIPTPPPPAAAKPKTIQVKRPVAPPAAKPGENIITPAPAPEAVAEARKSETARIDLPPDVGDRPTTRPKTIRIKRPDGTTARKALTIARPGEGEEPAAVAAATELPTVGAEEEAGTAFSILALVAVLVTCVLLYVLAAQTIAPGLPFAGKIV